MRLCLPAYLPTCLPACLPAWVQVALLMVPASKAYGEAGAPEGGVPPFADLKFEVQLLEIRRQTSCLGGGRHGGVQKDAHVYSELADQLLGRAPPQSDGGAPVEHRLPDERQPMPLTSEMPAHAQ